MLPGFAHIDAETHGALAAPTIHSTWRHLCHLVETPGAASESNSTSEGSLDQTDVRLLEAKVSAAEFASLFRARCPVDAKENLPHIPRLVGLSNQAREYIAGPGVEESKIGDSGGSAAGSWHAARELAAEWDGEQFRSVVAAFGDHICLQ